MEWLKVGLLWGIPNGLKFEGYINEKTGEATNFYLTLKE